MTDDLPFLVEELRRTIEELKAVENGLRTNAPEEKSKIRLPIGLGLNISRTNDKIIFEFVPNIIKPREAVVVREKKNLGLSEKCYVVLNDGRRIIVTLLDDVKPSTKSLRELTHIESL